jgi:hypothetical protein
MPVVDPHNKNGKEYISEVRTPADVMVKRNTTDTSEPSMNG